jgi:signal transduction histidine kinase/ActR/RegA family two-component response regulator
MSDGKTGARATPAGELPRDTLLRDLMSLMALPALWAGRDARTVLVLFGEAVEGAVPLLAMLVQGEIEPGAPAALHLKLRRKPWTSPPAADWAAFAEACERRVRRSETATAVDSPLGELRAVRLIAGAGTHGASLWFASDRPDFPTGADVAVLRAAVTLAGTALNAARLDAERERASRAKDEFLAMLGHELRNPLAPIMTTLELMKLKGVDHLAPEHAVLERQARHLGRLVDDLLDVNRIARDRLPLLKRPVSVRAVLDAALEAAQPAIEAGGHRVADRAERLDAVVDGDFERLQQVFVNLLINAAKFTPEGGRIEIEAQAGAAEVCVQVRDTGRGIEPSLLPHVFDLFTQGTTTIDRTEGGLGIGLALVRSLVRAHGGTVEADSAGAGAGATFTVRLPAMPSPAAASSGTALADRASSASPPLPDLAARPAGAHAMRVLLVDDNADALETTRMLLELSGFDVRAAGSPEAALAVLDTFAPDACVLDIGLPRLDGYQLAAEIRARMGTDPPVRFLALTGYGQASDRAVSRQEGFERHLTKPVDPAELLDALRSVTAPAGEHA